MSQVSDELLLAYLDGQLGGPQTRSVQQMIGASQDLHRRVERLKTTQGYLIQTFETLARRTRAPARGSASAEAPKSAHAARSKSDTESITLHTETAAAGAATPSRSTWKTLVWACAFTLLAALIGYGAGKWMRLNTNANVAKIDARVPAPANRWAQDVARLHAHFTTASVAADPQSQTNPDLVEMQLSRILNRPLKVPDFQEHELTFRRGQVLNYRGSRMMQLSYVGEDAGMVALYVMSGGPETGFSVTRQGDLVTVNWSAQGLRFVIAGDLPETGLRALAAVAMAQTKAQ